MGVAASIVEQRNLFESLKLHHELLFPKNNANSEDNESDTRDSDKLTTDKVIDDTFMEKVQQIYGSWCHTVALKKNTLFCELTDFEDTLGDAFRSELTPLIIDTSPDDKICTFFSYQPDVILLDAKAMIMPSSANGSVKNMNKTKSVKGNIKASSTKGVHDNSVSIEERLVVLDTARKAVVTAMKFGKLLVIRLGTSAPDFLHVFSDQALGIDTSKAGSAYFPLEVFYQAGNLLHDPDVFASNNDVSRKIPKDSMKAMSARAINSAERGEGEKASTAGSTYSSRIGETTEEQAATAAAKNGSATRAAGVAPTWAERLYREEDMKPHRNFALCRKEFRVCVTSQLPLESIEEYLFGYSAPATANISSSNAIIASQTAFSSAPPTGDGSCSIGTDFVNFEEGQATRRAMLPALRHFKIVSIKQEQTEDVT